MVTDLQVKALRKHLSAGVPLSKAALKVGIDAKTARKYRDRLPSECRPPRTWRTREDPFADVWESLLPFLERNPGLLAQTLFGYLQREYPGKFADGQLRTLQRKIKAWRAVSGPGKEVFFPQVHLPGQLGASDFCHLADLGVTIAGAPFDHMLYHFVLTYSNWETGRICFSESFESLSSGLQQAFWELGGVPLRHRTDSLTAAVQPLDGKEGFTRRYQELLSHYGVIGEHTQPRKAHENGDVEQRHFRFKVALDQALMLRGSRDFADRLAYQQFVRELFAQMNGSRQPRLQEELVMLRPLPATRLEVARWVHATVGPSSTIRVLKNTYSVPSSLIGEAVRVRVDVEHLEVFYGQRRVEQLPRLRGQEQSHICYRHLIDWLIQKPGAFLNYRYREALYPTSRFRIAYDTLSEQMGERGMREYLSLLHLAAHETEQGVDDALRALIATGEPIQVGAVKQWLTRLETISPATCVHVAPVDLSCYDTLLVGEGA